MQSVPHGTLSAVGVSFIRCGQEGV